MTNYLPSAYYPQTAGFYVVPKNIKSNKSPINFVFYRNRAYKDRNRDIKNRKNLLIMESIKKQKNKTNQKKTKKNKI
jgi:hypothetical protein